jgi:hypothetical protein
MPVDQNNRPAKILLFTPAAVASQTHIEMLRVQSLLIPRLQKHLPPEIAIASLMVVDSCVADLAPALQEIAESYDAVAWGVPPEQGTQWGIRKGTNFAATEGAASVGATHLLRVIQDAYVFDPQALAQLIRQAVATPGEWIAANVHHWPTGGHYWLCQQMGLKCEDPVHYPNGQVMLAPVKTWRDWYVTMPANIHHYWDDVMFGEAFKQKGDGAILDWPVCWHHWHGSDVKLSQRITALHRSGLEPQPMSLRTTLAACLIARNEARYIGEWIEFHRLVGVGRFFIYDDESTDATLAEVSKHDRGDVTIITQWDHAGTTPQMSAYNHWIAHYRDSAEWVAFIDTDEYLFSPTGADLRELLPRYETTPHHGAVFVTGLYFGDGGHAIRPAGLTIENYTRRGVAGQPNAQGKVIVRAKLAGWFGGPCWPHNIHGRDNGLTINEHQTWAPHAESKPPSIDLLRINHYFHRSQEEAAEKTTRADRNAGGRHRTADVMAAHNRNEIEDRQILRYLASLKAAMGFHESRK